MKKLILLSTLFLCGCASLNSVSLTQIPKQRQKTVMAKSSRFIVFFMNFDNDFVETVSNDLKNQCAGGRVQGILTKDETFNYFLGFVMKKQVTATGYCVKG